MKIHKKGVGIKFVFSGNKDSDIIPNTSRYHSEGRELVKMSVLRDGGFKIGKMFCVILSDFNIGNARHVGLEHSCPSIFIKLPNISYFCNTIQDSL